MEPAVNDAVLKRIDAALQRIEVAARRLAARPAADPAIAARHAVLQSEVRSALGDLDRLLARTGSS